MELLATIEIPKGSRNKYEVDHETGRVKLDRYLYTSMAYPADYGYLDDTLGLDGDPLDVLLLLTESVFPGCDVDVRPVGMFRMEDEAGGDDKVLAVVAGDPRWDEVQDIADVDKFTLDAIEHFFVHYKDLEPGKYVKGSTWASREEAEAEVRASVERFKAAGQPTGEEEDREGRQGRGVDEQPTGAGGDDREGRQGRDA
ncbi:inorganic diphosphatase [Brevibacterium daeguense]|uniref:Inorganic pyrophosphatase n=1 Tax=Brevibacterium daeguense TaxID=909936 RepID=A0ABP8EL32_9MICO|nr:inorganic diphosphatase [Brevibacterium daeguense]